MQRLGVIIDRRLSLTQDISVIVSRTHTRASLIHRCFLSTDRATVVFALISYGRLVQEYANSVWIPHRIADVREIEAVQRSFKKRLPGLAAFT